MNQRFTEGPTRDSQCHFLTFITVGRRGNMTTQDSYEYSTNTGTKLSVGFVGEVLGESMRRKIYPEGDNSGR